MTGEQPHQVPAGPRRFVNRERELATVGELVGAGAITVLSGLPGVGKTSLVRKSVEQLRGSLAGGELFVDFGADASVSDAVASCLIALGVDHAVLVTSTARLTALLVTPLSVLT